MSTETTIAAAAAPRRVDPGLLWHTIRRVDGSWQTFGLVEGQESNDPGRFDAVSCSGADDAPQLHVVGIVAGQLWHTIRNADGSWQNAFGHVETAAGNDPGPFTAVGCAASDEFALNLQVVGVVAGALWHTIRNATDASWQDLRPVQSQERNNPGAFNAVSCAAVRGVDLHVVGIVGGQLWHTIRNADGTWQNAFGHVETAAGNDPGPFTAVGCAAVGDELHVVGIVAGQLWHTIRHASGSWQDLRVVDAQEHNRPGRFVTVAAAGTGIASDPDLLQLAAATDNGKVLHTVRHIDGSWQADFGDVDGQAGNPGNVRAVACGGVETDLHLVAVV